MKYKTKMEWISVKDKLPSNRPSVESDSTNATVKLWNHKSYLCAEERGDKSYYITTGYWNGSTFITSTNCDNITHWMELPEPPQI